MIITWRFDNHNFVPNNTARAQIFCGGNPLLVFLGLNWNQTCQERLQSSFSRIVAFLIRWAWPPLGWCHTNFHSWFKGLYIRAFYWCIICYRRSLESVENCNNIKRGANLTYGKWVKLDRKNSWSIIFLIFYLIEWYNIFRT